MSLTYAEKLSFSDTIRTKFKEIKEIKVLIDKSIEDRDQEQYDYLISIVFGKISVIEKSLINLKELLIERLENA